MDEVVELANSPTLFPHAIDMLNDLISFIRLGRADYASASFLDGRILTPGTEVLRLPWQRVAATIEAAGLIERCHFIFHIGHVGSTLLSRLAGAHPAIFALREPAILRVFAQLQAGPDLEPAASSKAEVDARLAGCLKLWSRTFDPRERPIVKASSFVSELATALLSRTSKPRAVLMCVSPQIYLATILGGPNSRQEARILAPSRLRRLQRRTGSTPWRLDAMSEGEILALSWACETSALAEAARAAGERALRVDFDEFLANPPAGLCAAIGHFGIDATSREIGSILAGPDLHRYSKAPEYAYDAVLRHEVLNAARASHGAEIRRGLDWLDRAACESTPVRDALEFAGVVGWSGHGP